MFENVSNKAKLQFSLMVIVILITVLLNLMPDFHPERLFFEKYYWQVDTLIHFSYLFCLTIFLNTYIFKNANFTKFLYYGIGISVLLELSQFFIPGRSVSLLDITSNVIGLSGGLVVSNLLSKKRLDKKLNFTQENGFNKLRI